MRDILILASTGQPINDTRIEASLLDICLDTHESCDDSCPVFFLNKNSVPLQDGKCKCLLDGKKILSFIRESTGDVGLESKQPKKKKVVPVEHLERFARFKQVIDNRFSKLGIEGKPKYLSMLKPLTASQFVRIIDDYEVNYFPDRRVALIDVIIGMQNPSKKLGPDANLTIRRWMNWRLKVDSHEDLEKRVTVTESGGYTVVVVPDTESLLEQANRLKKQRDE